MNRNKNSFLAALIEGSVDVANPVPTREPEIVPTLEPEMVPTREPEIVPTLVAEDPEREPLMVPALAAETSERVKNPTAKTLRKLFMVLSL